MLDHTPRDTQWNDGGRQLVGSRVGFVHWHPAMMHSMNRGHDPDLRIVIALDATNSEPLFVMHPCRCDAPDPEASHMEPIEAPLAVLHAEGHALVICPECDSHILIVVAGRSDT